MAIEYSAEFCKSLQAAFEQLGLFRPEEFRKNAVKFGWELWEDKPVTPTTSGDATVTRSS